MLQKCFGQSTLSITQVFEWHKAFSENRRVSIREIAEGQTVNKEYYLAVLRRLRGAIRRKRLDLWTDNS